MEMPSGPPPSSGNMSGVYWHFGRLETMLGVLVCPGRGLFVYQPWAILAIISLVSPRPRPGAGVRLPGGSRRLDRFLSHPHRGPLLHDLGLARLDGRRLLGIADAHRHHPAPGPAGHSGHHHSLEITPNTGTDLHAWTGRSSRSFPLCLPGLGVMELGRRPHEGFLVLVPCTFPVPAVIAGIGLSVGTPGAPRRGERPGGFRGCRKDSNRCRSDTVAQAFSS